MMLLSSRLKTAAHAAGIHLLLSAVIIALSVGSLIFWFFPPPFISIDNTSTALKIIISVDLCLGPMLTLLLFKPGKKGLLFDLITIAVIQISALSYGIHAIYESRPAYLIFYGDTFYLADHKQIDESLLSTPDLKVGAFGRPKVVHSVIPGDNSQQMRLALESLGAGKPLHFNAKYFQPFSTISIEQLSKITVSPPKDSIYAGNSDYLYFHVLSATPDLFAAVERKSLRLVDIFSEQ